MVCQLVSVPPSQRELTKYCAESRAACATTGAAWRLVPTNSTRPPSATVSETSCSARLQHRHGLAEVENVDVVAHAEDVALHLRVPAVRLVAEVDACFEQLAHGKVGQCHGMAFLYRFEPPRNEAGVSPTGWTPKRPSFVCELRPGHPGRAADIGESWGQCKAEREPEGCPRHSCPGSSRTAQSSRRRLRRTTP